jgi:leucyl aminopeptidase
MDINVAVGDIARLDVGGIIVGVFEGQTSLDGDAARLDGALGGVLSQFIGSGEIKGKLNQLTLIHTLGKLPPARVAVVGLGKRDDLTADRVRGAAAEALRNLRGVGATTAGTVALGAGSAAIEALTSAQAIAEGAILGLYSFRKHLTRPADGEIRQLTILDLDADKLAALEEGLRRGKIVARAASLARDLVNEPSNFMTPSDLAGAAVSLAREHSIEVTVLDREQVRDLGMGAFLGVAQGSQQPPKFIVLRYKGRGSADIDIALVGKGITFDSGGISIKPTEGMGDMKGDMAGAASVMAAIGAIAQLKPAINVMAIVAATENLPSGTAFKPGDVLKAIDGKTIEVVTTDAEGRLTLADAIGYARKQGAREIVDVATLTGGIRVALGDICTGAFGNNQDLIDKVVAAGSEAGERVWQMPMYEEYKEQNKSDVADLKNSGGRNASSITAAQFLAEFAGDTPWVHLDIAGTSLTEHERGYVVKGATAVPTRTLVNLVLALARP